VIIMGKMAFAHVFKPAYIRYDFIINLYAFLIVILSFNIKFSINLICIREKINIKKRFTHYHSI
jgi:hypothetical protein